MKNYSIWKDVPKINDCKNINEDLNVDVLIVGGGITGISTLFQLKKSKLKTILVERNTCGNGVTSRSTAKITYLQEKIYMNIRKVLGENEAFLYLNSQIEGMNLLKDIIMNENINCDLEKVDSYLFTNEDDGIEKIEDEFEFLIRAKLDVQKVDNIPVANNVKSGLMVKDTYVFHPIKYINYFKEKYRESIYEHSNVESVDKVDDYYLVKVNGKIVKARYVVIATHYPYFLFPFFLPMKSHIETSYIGVRKTREFARASGINVDKENISFRYHTDKTNNYLIYLNQSFKSCDIDSINENFLGLQKENDFQYLWSNKDIITNDYMPFIGSIYKDDDTLLIATGYNTWGMINGTLAGQLLSDIILRRENKYRELFNPLRKCNLAKALKFPLDLGCSLKAYVKSTKENVNNKNVIYKKIDGEQVAIYVDSKGKEHIVYNRCPHMKCGVVFNDVEKTWDCLCHGSRFDIDGKVIEGPSNYNITFKK